MRKSFAVLFFTVLILIVWQLLRSVSSLPDYLFPSPLMVGLRVVELARDGLLFPSLAATVGRMLLGFVISCLIGLVLGILMGRVNLFESGLRSILLGLQSLPSAAWTPIALMIWGLDDSAIYFVIVMSSFSTIAVASSDAIRQIPPLYFKVAATMGTPKWQIPFRVVIPAALPGIITAIKLGWTAGWHGAVSAELIRSTVGLGFLLHMGRELNDAPQVLGVMLVTIGVGFLLDSVVFGRIERSVRTKMGL